MKIDCVNEYLTTIFGYEGHIALNHVAIRTGI
jgi:hypothetical protein